jgi:hypothetical protein
MQRENERYRVAIEGLRTDDGSRCTFLAVHETSGAWALYPHGAAQFGVRLTGPAAAELVAAMLDDSAQ